MSKTQQLLQRLRRLESADEFGLVECVTCDWIGHYSEADGGHFISAQITGLDERCINVQCKRCNWHLNGNQSKYLDWMIANHGSDVVNEIHSAGYRTRLEREEIYELREQYRARIKEEERRLS